MQNIQKIFSAQKENRWKISQSTAQERIKKLKRIREAIFKNQEEIQKAIYADYRKNPGETDLTEIYPTISELNHTISHLTRWMKPQKVKTPLTLFGTKSEIHYEAKGIVLILSPWNYPFQLLMAPLIAAIAAGNCAILKPSSKTAHTSAFLKKFISQLFDENEIALIEGNSEIADQLLTLPFDHIFFTGSPRIGKKVMEEASKNLTPVTLELGGKSPVVIDQTADIKKAAERILWGKFINAGQTCVAPDYVLIHENRVEDFVKEAISVIESRYGEKSKQADSPNFCRLVSDGALKTLKRLLDESVQKGATLAYGGQSNQDTRFLSPTLLTHVTNDSPIMREEIFGPILPLIAYRSLDDALSIIQKRDKPLALYIFSKDSNTVDYILKNTSAGGSCVNSLIIHLANPDLPFGGVGYSGMGNYHGFFGFRTFSHERAVLHQRCLDTLKMFYPPYTPKVRRIINLATKWL
ncbi:MAG: aldehyde dehydrogenase family protein [Deltaproteobacteria bacterium]|nr:aldehyde dehydrogenase family protein [Deltaproteobacteria bacterium]